MTTNASIVFTELEAALFAFAKAASGLADAAIIFDSQDGISPQTAPYMTIRMGDLVKVGMDATRYDYSAARPAGQEIHRASTGLRELAVTFAFFTPDVVGSATARTLAATVEASLERASLRDALNTAGLGVLAVGPVRWVPKINNTKFEGRAVLEVRFAVPQGSLDVTGYIKTVNVEPTINGVALPIWPIKISD